MSSLDIMSNEGLREMIREAKIEELYLRESLFVSRIFLLIVTIILIIWMIK